MSLRFGSRPSLPLVLQAEKAECGLCCLSMIAGYHGQRNDLVDLRKKFGMSSKGVTLRSLIEVAENIGLSSRAIRAEIDSLGEVRLPAVLHWNFDHFVVLKKVKNSGIIIHDPAVGERFYSFEETSQRFTGVVLELVPRSDFVVGEFGQKLSIWEFWKGTKGLQSSLLQILLLSIFVQLFALATPFYMQVVVDDVLVRHDVDLLDILALGFLALTLVSVLTKVIRGLANLYLVNQLSYNIGNSVLHHLMRLPLAYFENRHIGDVISRFRSIEPIQALITGGLVAGLIDGLLAITTLFLIFLYSVEIASVVCLSALFYVFFRVLQFRPLREANHEDIVAKAKVDTNFMETIRALQPIKLSGKEFDREGTWRNLYSESINTSARIGRLSISYQAANSALTGSEYVLIIYLGAAGVIENSLTIGMLYAVVAYRSSFSSSVVSIIDLFIQFRMVGLHLERVSDITKTEQEEGISGAKALVLPLDGPLTLDQIAYRYSPTEMPVIEGFSAKLEEGSFTAIVGPSGVGKSTLLKMLLGLTQPSSGVISIGGVPIRRELTGSYRRVIAATTQEDSLFSGSLKENISFFDSSPDMEKIERACRQACIFDEISDGPMGFETLIGDMGTSLSVGQQQRVIIARALYSEPSYLFMG